MERLPQPGSWASKGRAVGESQSTNVERLVRPQVDVVGAAMSVPHRVEDGPSLYEVLQARVLFRLMDAVRRALVSLWTSAMLCLVDARSHVTGWERGRYSGGTAPHSQRPRLWRVGHRRACADGGCERRRQNRYGPVRARIVRAVERERAVPCGQAHGICCATQCRRRSNPSKGRSALHASILRCAKTVLTSQV